MQLGVKLLRSRFIAAAFVVAALMPIGSLQSRLTAFQQRPTFASSRGIWRFSKSTKQAHLHLLRGGQETHEGTSLVTMDPPADRA